VPVFPCGAVPNAAVQAAMVSDARLIGSVM
jgi:hypothetical protein